jgi:hypothetical protein
MKNLRTLNAVFTKNIIERVTRIFSAVALGTILTVTAVLSLLLLPAGETRADGPDDAHVVVVFPTEQGMVRPISFTTSISRIGALQLAGFNVVAIGDTVCSIDGVGCPGATDMTTCFCADNWWAQGHWDSGSESWDTLTWPPPLMSNGDIGGFRWSNTAWGPPLLPGPSYKAASGDLEWLQTQQSAENGSYGDSVGSSVEAMLAIGANNLDADQWRTSPISPSLLDYLQSGDNAASYAATNVGKAGKLAVALAGVGQDPQNFNGLNLVISLTNYYSATTGAFDEADINQAWAMLGWRAASQTVPASATHHLVAGAMANGGWEWSPGFGSDTNTTALAIQALVAGGECITSPNIADGLDYLKSAQNSDGGFPYDPVSIWGTDSDTNSTAWVVQALLALGEDPTSVAWTVNSSNPISYLLSMQLVDGSFEWQTGFGSNLLASQQVIAPLIGHPFSLQVDPPDQGQCFVSPPSQASGQSKSWLPIIFKDATIGN